MRTSPRSSRATPLADAIGITFQQVQKYEKGVNRVGSGRLVRIATALDVPVMTLLDGIVGGRRRAGGPAALALIAHAQSLRLIHAFATIDDKGVRRALLGLAEGIARVGSGGARAPLRSPPAR
ncbi:MAG: helix-turn-helix domain-containing protein, partial [Rhodoplanes sp.]